MYVWVKIAIIDWLWIYRLSILPLISTQWVICSFSHLRSLSPNVYPSAPPALETIWMSASMNWGMSRWSSPVLTLWVLYNMVLTAWSLSPSMRSSSSVSSSSSLSWSDDNCFLSFSSCQVARSLRSGLPSALSNQVETFRNSAREMRWS